MDPSSTVAVCSPPCSPPCSSCPPSSPSPSLSPSLPSSSSPSLYSVGDKALAHYQELLFEAKILKIGTEGLFIHYNGWPPKFDEWVPADRLLEYNHENKEKAKTMKAGKKMREEEAKNKNKKGKNGENNDNNNNNSSSDGKKKKRKLNENDPTIEMEKNKEKENNNNIIDLSKINSLMPGLLKNQLLKDWEQTTRNNNNIITPVAISVKSLFDQFNSFKLEGEGKQIGENNTNNNNQNNNKENNKKQEEENKEEKKEEENQENIKMEEEIKNNNATTELNIRLGKHNLYSEISEGLIELFNRSIDTILLYRGKERDDYEKNIKSQSLIPCSQYGIEHLLRLFIRLPSLILNQTNSNQQDIKYLSMYLTDFIKWLDLKAHKDKTILNC